MGTFDSVTRDSLDVLNQPYRVPGLIPNGVPPQNKFGTGTADDTAYFVNDEFIRVIPFVSVDANKPYGKQYIAAASTNLSELPYTATGIASSLGGSSWTSGFTTAFGQPLASLPKRFKKISAFVRSDELMSLSDDMLKVQVQLASIAVVRALSLGVLQSFPGSGASGNDDLQEFTGLPFTIVGSAQDVTYVPIAGPGTVRGLIGGLSKIEALCSPSSGDFGAGPDVFVMSSRARWRLCKELEDKGVEPTYKECKLTGRMQLHFHGIPVLVGRVKEGPNTGGGNPFTDAWAVKLFGPSGVRILHQGGDSQTFGVRMEQHATVPQAVAGTPPVDVSSASRGVEVYGVYSLLIPELQSVARLNSIPAPDPFTTIS